MSDKVHGFFNLSDRIHMSKIEKSTYYENHVGNNEKVSISRRKKYAKSSKKVQHMIVEKSTTCNFDKSRIPRFGFISL